MKSKIIIMLACLVTLVAYAREGHPSDQKDIFKPVGEAMRMGDAKKLIPYLSPFVDIDINGTGRTYSSTQAESTCRAFFQKHPAISFSIIHTGHSKKGLKYAIGQYISSDSRYSVLIKTRYTNTKHLIYEISFTEE